MKRALLISESVQTRTWIALVLEEAGYETDHASNGYSGLNYASYEKYQVLLVSMNIPLLKAEDLLPKVKKLQKSAAVALINYPAGRTDLGRFKPFLLPQITTVEDLRSFLNDLEPKAAPAQVPPGEETRIIGLSDPMQEYFDKIRKIQQSSVTVLIYGGSGTGKELTARSIHLGGPRSLKRFVTVNSAAIPETLLESELFGHEKGAFTGAHERRIGRFELAHQGTLFLDEVAELAPSIQAKFLRVLEEQAFERVGGNETIHVDVRIISATNRDLKKLVESGAFREDLFYRLNAIPLRVPYLRERREDIPLLARYFLDKYLPVTGKCQAMTISEAALKRLMAYHWPGNVRELENVIMQAMVLCEGTVVDVNDIPDEIHETRAAPSSPPPEEGPLISRACSMQELEKEAIRIALENCNFNASRAARLLNIGRMTFYRKVKQYAIPLKEE